MYAVFEDGSRQYRVREGDVVEVDYREVPNASELVFDRVLLYQGNEGVLIGQPQITDARIVGHVVESGPGEKVYVQKFRRHANYHRRRGHRQKYTRVQIRQILTPGAASPTPTTPEAATT